MSDKLIDGLRKTEGVRREKKGLRLPFSDSRLTIPKAFRNDSLTRLPSEHSAG